MNQDVEEAIVENAELWGGSKESIIFGGKMLYFVYVKFKMSWEISKC